ncbi:hypothetical protein DRN75_01915 [Nanoarchaeota archaeon]|nr:MAG: hypothetical protein DRN75_01915 [Nanoarchaeota archaeon]
MRANAVTRELLAFALGLVIILSITSLADVYIKPKSREIAAKQYAKLLAEYVNLQIYHLYTIGNNATLVKSLPEKVSDADYKIVIENNKVCAVIATGHRYCTEVSAPVDVEGEYTSGGKLRIDFSNNTIVISNYV